MKITNEKVNGEINKLIEQYNVSIKCNCAYTGCSCMADSLRCLIDSVIEIVQKNQSNIDYKKLLKICMSNWYSAEDCCWDGSYWDYDRPSDALSKEEEDVVKEMYVSITGDKL